MTPEDLLLKITVAWQEGDAALHSLGWQSKAPGWYYVITWEEGVGTSGLSVDYGFATEQAAREAAETEMQKIVESQPYKPVLVHPEV